MWKALLLLGCLLCSFGAICEAASPGPVRVIPEVSKLADLETPGAALAVSWSDDGSALAAASDWGQALSVWSRDGRLVQRIRRGGGGPTLGGSITLVHGSSLLVFPQGTKDPSTAFFVWDVATGAVTKQILGPLPGGDKAYNLAQHFTRAGDLLVASTTFAKNFRQHRLERNVMAFDTRSWEMLYAVTAENEVDSLSLFSNGRLLALGSRVHERISILDAHSGATISEFPAYEHPDSPYGSLNIGAIAGSPAGDLVFGGVGLVVLHGAYANTPEQHAWEKSIENAHVYRVRDGSVMAAFNDGALPIRQAMWDPKGRFVAFVDNARHLFLWAPWASRDYLTVSLPAQSLSLAISPDGGRIAVATNGGVRVYSLN